jgi:hypothetical protein
MINPLTDEEWTIETYLVKARAHKEHAERLARMGLNDKAHALRCTACEWIERATYLRRFALEVNDD